MPTSQARYPHLAPSLRRLEGDALPLWGDSDVRRLALADLLTCWERSDEAALAEAIRRIDEAVTAGLRLLELPRGPILGCRLDAVGRGWQGRKLPMCELVLDALAVQQSIRRLGIPDDVFRIWVHESIHARRPFTSAYATERVLAAGYEEGLAEGLARAPTRAGAGMSIVMQSYNLYVAAYETLAEVLHIPVELIWRHLWMAAPGEVRQHFLAVVERAWSGATGQPLRERQRHLLQSRGGNRSRGISTTCCGDLLEMTSI